MDRLETLLAASPLLGPSVNEVQSSLLLTKRCTTSTDQEKTPENDKLLQPSPESAPYTPEKKMCRSIACILTLRKMIMRRRCQPASMQHRPMRYQSHERLSAMAEQYRLRRRRLLQNTNCRTRWTSKSCSKKTVNGHLQLQTAALESVIASSCPSQLHHKIQTPFCRIEFMELYAVWTLMEMLWYSPPRLIFTEIRPDCKMLVQTLVDSKD